MFVERYNSQEEIPEGQREDYREVTRGDETFHQHKAFAGLVDALENSKSKTAKYKEDFESINGRLSKFEQEAIDKEEKLKRDALAASEDKEGVFKYDLSKRDEKIEALTGELNEFKQREVNREIDSFADKVARGAANKDSIEQLAFQIKPRLKRGEDGSIIVLDKQGHPTSMGIDELVADIKSDKYYKMFVDGVTTTGLSGSNQKTGSSVNNPWAKGSVNLTEQGRIINSDPVLASKLKAAAGQQ